MLRSIFDGIIGPAFVPAGGITDDVLDSGLAGVGSLIIGDGGNLVLADPPRAGLDKQTVKQLLRIKAPKMIIVACDPSTLARDVAALSTAYKIDKLTLIDLFPQTYHMETVLELSAI